jgi:hypothetical protein
MLQFTSNSGGGGQGEGQRPVEVTSLAPLVTREDVSVQSEPRTELQPSEDTLRAHTVLQPLTAARLAFVAIVEIETPEEGEGPPNLILIVRTPPDGMTLDRKGLGAGAEEWGTEQGANNPDSRVDPGLFHFLSGNGELLTRQMAAARQELRDISQVARAASPVLLDQVFREWVPALTSMLTQVLQFPLRGGPRHLSAFSWRDMNEELMHWMELSSVRHPDENASTPLLPSDGSTHGDQSPRVAWSVPTNTWFEWAVVVCWMVGMHSLAGLNRSRQRPLD